MPRRAIQASKRLSQPLAATAMGAAFLAAAAGSEVWAARCAYAAAYLAVLAGHLSGAAVNRPDEVRAPGRENRAAGMQGARLLALAGFGGPMATLVVASVDRRLGWSPGTGPAVRLVALLVMALGHTLLTRAAASNESYAGGTGQQTERCAAIAKCGPYRLVRHPAYLAMIVRSLAMPCLLGSRWALVPALLTVGCTVALTALEDRNLRTDLAGYQEYARQVHFRLLPGLW